MSSFLVWDKQTKEIIDCVPQPIGSNITLEAMFSHRDPLYLTKYEGMDILETITKRQFIEAFVLDENNNVIPRESLKTVEQKFEEAKLDRKKYIASRRYAEEVGGIEVGGAVIKTDRESQSQLSNALVSLSNGFVSSVDWKGANGWVSLGLAEVQAISTIVAQHVQTLFTKEKQKVEAIDAATTLEEVVAVDWD